MMEEDDSEHLLPVKAIHRAYRAASRRHCDITSRPQVTVREMMPRMMKKSVVIHSGAAAGACRSGLGRGWSGTGGPDPQSESLNGDREGEQTQQFTKNAFLLDPSIKVTKSEGQLSKSTAVCFFSQERDRVCLLKKTKHSIIKLYRKPRSDKQHNLLSLA